MRKTGKFELPDELQSDHQKAKKLEYWTIAFLISVVILMYLVMGSSQAMKTAWLEDMLGLIPPIVFLIASKIAVKAPNKGFPYGYHRVNSIAFLVGSVALFAMGCFLVFDGLLALLKAEHPTIHTVIIFGKNIWMGWLMILVLIYSAIPAIILGYKKLPLAKSIHNKVLFTDAKANKADYLTAGAACLGIIGIGFGFWWADAVAALIISVDILHDGFTQLKSAITDLMNRTPKTVDEKKYDPIVKKLQEMFNELPWIESAEVRLREEGQVYFGDVAVVPKKGTNNLTEKIDEAKQKAYELHWKIFDLMITPTKDIPEELTEELRSNN